MEKNKKWDDQHILERIRSGDRTVFGDCYRQFRKVIRVTLSKMGASENEFKDIFQETMIVLWEKARDDNFELRARLTSYLTMVAKYQWLAWQRKNGRFIHNAEPEDKPQMEIQVDQQFEDEEEAILLLRAIQRLKPICRSILTMFYYERIGFEEIAGRLKLANAKVAKSKKYQCKKQLESIVKPILEEGER